MITSYCLKCGKLVPSGTPLLHSGVFLAKMCPECGITIERIEIDHDFFEMQEIQPRSFEQNDCYMVDITNKCDAACRSCYNKSVEDIPLSRIFDEILDIPKHARVLLSGGEPLQSEHIFDIVELLASNYYKPVLLSNGRHLTPETYNKLLDKGLSVSEGFPQISISLGVPGTNNTFYEALCNVRKSKVSDIAFTVENLDEVDEVVEVATCLRGQFQAVCIRTAFNGRDNGLYVSEIARRLGSDVLPVPSIHGYRSVVVEKDGIIYKIISWPTWGQYDVERYANRGVWYKGDNVVTTLVKNASPFPLP